MTYSAMGMAWALLLLIRTPLAITALKAALSRPALNTWVQRPREPCKTLANRPGSMPVG